MVIYYSLMSTIRFILVDDHPTFREGLARLLSDEEDLECVGCAADGFEAVNLARELQPDIAIIDVSMPNLNGIEAARRIKLASPGIAILILSAYNYQSYILTSLQVGASGYMSKDRSLNEIASAIRLINTGDSVLDIKATDHIIEQLRYSDNGNGSISGELNTREMEVIRLAAQGMSNKEIASTLFISERTVQTHLVNIFKKLKVNSRTQAVLSGLRKGWLTLDNLT